MTEKVGGKRRKIINQFVSFENGLRIKSNIRELNKQSNKKVKIKEETKDIPQIKCSYPLKISRNIIL